MNGFGGFFSAASDRLKWTAMRFAFILPCVIAFGIQFSAKDSVSELLGRETIKRYLIYNCAALGITVLTFIIFVIAFIRCTVGKYNSGTKLVSFICCAVILIFTITFLSMSVSHILSDYKAPTEFEPEEYVLSESGLNYYLGFEDGGEYTQIPIPEDVYEKLSGRFVIEETEDSDIYNIIVQSGYSFAELYDGNGVTVYYYFYSAIYESVSVSD